MGKMEKKVRKALVKSVKHWEENIARWKQSRPPKESEYVWFRRYGGADSCPLCQTARKFSDGICLFISNEGVLLCPLRDAEVYACCREWFNAIEKSKRGETTIQDIVDIKDRVQSELDRWDAGERRWVWGR